MLQFGADGMSADQLLDRMAAIACLASTGFRSLHFRRLARIPVFPVCHKTFGAQR